MEQPFDLSGFRAAFPKAAYPLGVDEPGYGKSSLSAFLPGPHQALGVRIITSQQMFKPLHPASLTKLGTVHCTLDLIKAGALDPQTRLTLSPRARSVSDFRSGAETLSIDEALDLIAVSSCNDAAVALAEHIGGSEGNFVASFLQPLTQTLGMTRTCFWNATGLPMDQSIYRTDPAAADIPYNVSCARDMLTLATALIQTHPDYLQRASQPTYSFEGKFFHNVNGLIHRAPMMEGGGPVYDGLKTGSLHHAGYHLIATRAVPEGGRQITIVMGALTRDKCQSEVMRETAEAFSYLYETKKEALALTRKNNPA